MPRVVMGCLLLISCGRTEPVRYPPLPPVPVCSLWIEPRALDFGSNAQGSLVTRELVVRNVGGATCALNGVTFGAANDPTFVIDRMTWLRPLGPDESLTIAVNFAAGPPALPFDRSGTLELRTTDALQPTVSIALSARVVFCRLTPSPSPLDFGNVALNTTATAHVTLLNEGSTDCEVSSLELAPITDSNFALPPQPRTFTVRPGQSTRVIITFSAQDSSPPHRREGRLRFDSDDPNAPEGSVPLWAYINTVCTEAGQYIYTVDNDGRFSRFDPVTLTYLDLAPLRCPTTATPFSMNVDQEGVAWVIFADGNLFSVDTATAACRATTYQPNQAGFFTYGMGSTFDSATGLDTLYLANPESQLGTLSFPSLTVRAVGSFPLDSVELAGTGDGQLWAFAPPRGATAVLARLDPANGAVLERYSLPTITSVGGWAIKFFGGAFFIFIGSDIWKVERSSLDPRQPTPLTPPTRVLVSAGRDIVGAGVSTCAPTQ